MMSTVSAEKPLEAKNCLINDRPEDEGFLPACAQFLFGKEVGPYSDGALEEARSTAALASGTKPELSTGGLTILPSHTRLKLSVGTGGLG